MGCNCIQAQHVVPAGQIRNQRAVNSGEGESTSCFLVNDMWYQGVRTQQTEKEGGLESSQSSPWGWLTYLKECPPFFKTVHDIGETYPKNDIYN